MSKMNFTGWVLLDSDGNYLPIEKSDGSSNCDSGCGVVAVYDVIVPDGRPSPFCQDCLQNDFEDPNTPDAFFAPVRAARSNLITYSDGAQQLVINL